MAFESFDVSEIFEDAARCGFRRHELSGLDRGSYGVIRHPSQMQGFSRKEIDAASEWVGTVRGVKRIDPPPVCFRIGEMRVFLI